MCISYLSKSFDNSLILSFQQKTVEFAYLPDDMLKQEIKHLDGRLCCLLKAASAIFNRSKNYNLKREREKKKKKTEITIIALNWPTCH